MPLLVIGIISVLAILGVGGYFVLSNNEELKVVVERSENGGQNVNEETPKTSQNTEGAHSEPESSKVSSRQEDEDSSMDGGFGARETEDQQESQGFDHSQEPVVPPAPFNVPQSPQMPTGFSLPFKIQDIDQLNGEINPIGIVRFSQLIKAMFCHSRMQ